MSTAAPRGRGRRPGTGNTREDIIRAARDVFGRHGYDGATLRAIAARAGVDPAMVRHFFGDKDGLFRAALNVPFDPGTALPALLAGGTDGLGERLVRFFLSVWESDPAAEGGGPSPFVTFLRGAASHETSAALLRDLITRRVFGPLLAELDADDGMLRATLVGSQLVGLGMARYVVRIEPLASLPADRLVRIYGRTVQRYLTGDLE
ncbi:MAG TPA: TetR family transcriptional regulator [Mycobacteriales bacterium]|nr:TetR family transcriptional regulator [Mycobacteriales bacterium]